MFKKLICLLAVLCLLFTMTACFDSGDTDDTEDTTKASASTTNNSATTTNGGATTTDGGSTSGFSEGLLFAESDYGNTAGYKVVGIGTCTDTVVKIPDTYKHPLMNQEYPVIEIADEAFLNCTQMKEVVIPDSVRKLGNRVFKGCSSLESITTPFMGGGIHTDDVLGLMFGTQEYDGGVAVEQHTMHGYNAHDEVETYYIPSSLRSVTITKASYLYGAFSNCNFLTSVTLCTTDDAHPAIGAYAFYGCTDLTELKFAGKVTSIGDYAFGNCTKLKKVTFNAESPMLEEIGDSAFENCTALGSFNISSGVEKIGGNAFAGCSSLTTISIPAGVKYVGSDAFDEACTSLTSIYVYASYANRQEWSDNWNASSVTPSYN